MFLLKFFIRYVQHPRETNTCKQTRLGSDMEDLKRRINDELMAVGLQPASSEFSVPERNLVIRVVLIDFCVLQRVREQT
jgi:hypothetical protein